MGVCGEVISGGGGMFDIYADRYIGSLRRSQRTKEEYSRDLGLFLTWCEQMGKKDPREVSGAEIDEFLANLRRGDGKPYAPKTKNRVLSVVRGYYKFMIKDRYIGALDDPTAEVERSKIPHREPLFLEIDEGAAMVVTVRDRLKGRIARGEKLKEGEEERQVRDLALLTLLLGAGLRLTEVVNLNVSTWRQAMMNKWLKVIGKGDKERRVPPSDEALENVQRYLRGYRPDIEPDELGAPLFVSRQRNRLSRHQIQRIVKDLALEAAAQGHIDIEKARKISPHKLRATWVTQLLINGVNPRLVQKMAGHESLDTTMLYAGVQDVEELVRLMKEKQVRYG